MEGVREQQIDQQDHFHSITSDQLLQGLERGKSVHPQGSQEKRYQRSNKARVWRGSYAVHPKAFAVALLEIVVRCLVISMSLIAASKDMGRRHYKVM